MVKQRMSTADVAGEVACLRQSVLGMRVANVYDVNAKVRQGPCSMQPSAVPLPSPFPACTSVSESLCACTTDIHYQAIKER